MTTSKRLTKQIRNDIVEIVINKTFDERRANLHKVNSEIFHKLVDSILPDGFLDVLKADSSREKWFTRVSAFEVNHVHSKGVTFSGNQRIAPSYLKYSQHSSVVCKNLEDISDEMKAIVKDHVEARECLKKDEVKLGASVREIVNSVNSFAKLKEIWPEVEQYYKLEDNVMYPLTTVNPADLNGMIQQLKLVA